MTLAAIIELILFVLKLIFNVKASPMKKIEYFKRWRQAKKKAEESGDTSELETLASELRLLRRG